MNATTYSYAEFENANNKASLHQIIDGSPRALFKRDADAQSPAGGASSTVKDLAKWIVMLLGDGYYQGKQVLTKKALQEMQQPAIVSGVNAETGEINFYALGWSVKWDQAGRKIVSHNGGFALGARTYLAMIPQEKIGIVVLSNAAWQGAPEAIVDVFYAAAHDEPLPDNLLKMWNDRWSKLNPPQNATSPEHVESPLPLQSYSGSYKNDYYGDISIAMETPEQLVLKIGPKPLIFPLKHFSRDTFSFETHGENAIGIAYMTFTIGENGKAQSLAIDYLNEHGNGTFMVNLR
jgi:hypothetical protein